MSSRKNFLGSQNKIQAQRDAELGITNEPESQNSQVKFATFADSPHDDDEEVRRFRVSLDFFGGCKLARNEVILTQVKLTSL